MNDVFSSQEYFRAVRLLIGHKCGAIPLKYMADNNNENLDSPNEELDELDELETSLQESDEDSEELKTLKEQNRHLFARAKKAEGFTLVDGAWVKKQPAQPKIDPVAPKETPVPQVKQEDISKAVQEQLNQRELEALEVSDELKKEVQDYAKLHAVSIKKALDSSYLKFMIEEENKKKRIEDASLGGKKKAVAKGDMKDKSPADFDLTTEEGKQGWADYQKWLETQ